MVKINISYLPGWLQSLIVNPNLSFEGVTIRLEITLRSPTHFDRQPCNRKTSRLGVKTCKPRRLKKGENNIILTGKGYSTLFCICAKAG